jgi:hypothetical protein
MPMKKVLAIVCAAGVVATSAVAAVVSYKHKKK